MILTLLAFLMALAVNAICSLGMVLQKIGIGWQTKGRPRDASWRREFFIWLLGFLLVFFVPFLNFIALYVLSPAIVGAMVGTCVAFTALFSALILGVKLKLRQIAASALLFAGIIVFTIFNSEKASSSWSLHFYVLIWTLPFAVAGTAWLVMHPRRKNSGLRGNPGSIQSDIYGAVMGAVSGALGGVLLISLKLFQIECGTNLLRYPLTPFMYAHISVGIAGPYLMQVAYRHGSIGAVSNAIYASQVVYPVVATWLVFSCLPNPVQLGGMAAIIGSVFVLATESGKGSPEKMMTGSTR